MKKIEPSPSLLSYESSQESLIEFEEETFNHKNQINIDTRSSQKRGLLERLLTRIAEKKGVRFELPEGNIFDK